ncbi:hypothetical protein Tco_0060296 [Tanacetum coccineum]
MFPRLASNEWMSLRMARFVFVVKRILVVVEVVAIVVEVVVVVEENYIGEVDEDDEFEACDTPRSQMHNNILASGSKERPPMLAPDLVTLAVPTEGDNQGQPQVVRQETYINTTPENRKLIDDDAEAIYMILNGIGDNIYSTVDACSSANELDGESIESYYSRFYKMMNEMVRNKLKVDTMQVNAQFLQQLQPEWSRFVTIVKQANNMDIKSYHKLFDILKQYHNVVNEIRVERIAKNANPLALVAATQYYPDDYTQSPKPYKTHAHSSRQTPSTRTHATTRNKGKEIVKPPSPQYESASEEDSEEEGSERQANAKTTRNDRKTRQFGNQRTVAVAGNREIIGNQVVQQSAIQCFNCKGFEQDEWLQDIDEEPDEQELEAHYVTFCIFRKLINAEAEAIHMILNGIGDNIYSTVDACSSSERSANAKKFGTYCKTLQEHLQTYQQQSQNFIKHQEQECGYVSKNNDRQTSQFGTQRIMTVARNRETQESKGIPLSAEQNEWLHDTDEKPVKQELEAHYMYMENIQEVLHVVDDNSGPTYDVEPLEKVHTNDDYNVFANETRHSEQPKSIKDTYLVEKTVRNVIPTSSNMCDNEGKADQNVDAPEDERVVLASLIANLKLDIFSIAEFKQTINKEKAELERGKALGLLEETKRLHNESSKTQSYETFYVKEENAKLVNQISKHESRIPHILKEKEQLKKDFKAREDKDIDKQISLENQYLKKAQWKKPCLYNVQYDKNDLANMFAPESEETIRLAEESRSKLDMLIPLAQNTVANDSLFETHLKKEMFEDLKYVQSLEKESMENDDLKARLQEKTNVNAELHNLLNKMKGKSVDTKFEKQLVGRQPNAFKFQKSSVMGKPSKFSNSLERQFFLKSRFAPKTNEKKDLSKPVTSQILPQRETQ